MTRFASKLLRAAFLAAPLLIATPAGAVVVENLHRALVDVEDHSQAQLREATRAGLAQVFVKVSGSPDVLANEQLAAALDDASRYMQRYRYLRTDEDVLKLQVHFDPGTVNELLRAAGAPLWTANRPPLLLWLVVDEADSRAIATPDTHPLLFEQLQGELERRGVPVSQPLYDLQDTLAVSVDELWRLDELAVFRASERYGAADVLVGRLRALSGDRWMGDWVYLHNRESAAGSFYGEALPVFSADLVDFVANRMATHYAVDVDSDAMEVLVRVDAIDSFDAYRAVLRYFEQIELVDDAWPAYLEGDSVVFRLAGQADPASLQRILSLNRRLELQTEPAPLARGPVHLDLVYRWIP